MSEVLARDGHLLDLAIDRALVGDLDAASTAALEAHVEACASCRERWGAAERFVARPLPPRRGAEVARLPRRRWAVVGLGLALAASMLLVLRDRPPSADGFRSRGSDLDFQVYREEGEDAVRLHDGDTVRPGDRLGFRYETRSEGFLLVAGIDKTGSVYPCYPQGEAPEAAPVQPTSGPVTLRAAIRLDATPGDERVLAVRCPDAFSLASLEGAMKHAPPDRLMDAVPAGCQGVTLRLSKDPGG